MGEVIHIDDPSRDIIMRFDFDGTDTLAPGVEGTITSFTAGVYTSITDDGGSGTITISVDNGATYVSFASLNPLALILSDDIRLKRDNALVSGWVEIRGISTT